MLTALQLRVLTCLEIELVVQYMITTIPIQLLILKTHPLKKLLILLLKLMEQEDGASFQETGINNEWQLNKQNPH